MLPSRPFPSYTAIAARGFQAHEDVIVDAFKDASGGNIDTAITSVWTTTGTFAREHPETVAAWRKSLTQAIEFLNANEREARALMQSWLKIPADVIVALSVAGLGGRDNSRRIWRHTSQYRKLWARSKPTPM